MWPRLLEEIDLIMQNIFFKFLDFIKPMIKK